MSSDIQLGLQLLIRLPAATVNRGALFASARNYLRDAHHLSEPAIRESLAEAIHPELEHVYVTWRCYGLAPDSLPSISEDEARIELAQLLKAKL